ncbi:MAG: thiamine pyrophosphate-binding protein [Sulfuricella sp.]|nr:thiamine pyrophosphate-binding protein [Sulfuricella sp.]
MNGLTAQAIHPDEQHAGTVQPASPELADLLIAYLEQIGVEYVFGVPGGAIEPLFNAMARSQRRGGLRPVVARHEAGAAFMADGYARETGKLGVCCATSGPGATNLITGVACAHDNNIPLLAISGLPALPSFGRGALQESTSTGVDAFSMFRHCTRYNAMVSHASQFERKVANALLAAHQMPNGPVHLAIPLDIQRSPIPHVTPAYELTTLLGNKTLLIDERAVWELKNKLQCAPRVVFLVGAGCGEAIEAIMELTKMTKALFVTTPDAKGFINPRHPAYCGVFGFGGHLSANALLGSAPDIVLAFGTGFSELISGGWCGSLLNNLLVHIDDNQENLMRSPMAQMHVRGDIHTVCERLIQWLTADSPSAIQGARDLLGDVHHPQVILQDQESYDSDATPIKPQRLMKILSERCPPHTRFLADIGNSMVWAAHYLQPRDRRLGGVAPEGGFSERRSGNASWFRVIMDFCPMGWSIGASVGVACGNPKYPVVCITGDGAYLMSGQEITVAILEKLTVVFVILNDSALGMVKHGQRMAKAERIGCELPPIDYCKIADAMGVPGHVIESPQELEALDFDAILHRKGPTLIDVRIDGEEVPPIGVRMKALGTLK